jgi:hypothetical protein
MQLIEQRLFWTGQVSRQDLREALDISEATAARLLRAYRELAPENMVYNPGGRRSYEASSSFTPMLYRADHRDSGLPAQAVAPELFDEDRERVDRAVLAIATCLRSEKTLRIRYTDWQGVVTQREIQPISWILLDSEKPAIIHAYCYLRNAYRSFELARMSAFEVTDRDHAPDRRKSPEDAPARIVINEKVIEVPISCVYPVVARAYAATSLRDASMKNEIRAAVERTVAAGGKQKPK